MKVESRHFKLKPRDSNPWAFLAIALILIGCHSNGPATRPPSAPITNTDPCAMRLHDLCGPLLLHYSTHGQLPHKLEELRDVPGFGQSLEFSCPVSKRPYVYNPVGIAKPERNTRIIIYDALPSHSGLRWGVSIEEPQPGQPLIAKVIALPESLFTFQPK